MGNSSKTNGHTERHLAPFKLVDLGECKTKGCPNIKTDGALHYHGLMFVSGVVDKEITDEMKRIIKELGYVGDLVVEYISRKEFDLRLKKERAARKQERVIQKYNSKYHRELYPKQDEQEKVS